MTDSYSGHSSEIKQTLLDSEQHGQAQNVAEEQKTDYGAAAQGDIGANADTLSEAAKDKIDDVDNVDAKGPKRADQYSGGRVLVGETGDLHDLAAKRQAS